MLADYRTKYKQEQGFDWSLAHKIMDRLPEGKWTGYYYLAEAVGTSAQAVANHLVTCGICVNAYRVLTWDGHIAAGFHRADPTDDRDTQAVLEAEGVSFAIGAADPEAKLTADDLLALAED